jgi:hypothetical protein
VVEEARAAARRIEGAKAREAGIVARPSNGQERRPTLDEKDLHRAAVALMSELVPAELRLKTAEESLHAVTAATLGIPGVVRVTRSEPTSRFDPRRAEEILPHLVARFRTERTTGSFRWRKVRIRCTKARSSAARRPSTYSPA